MEHVAKGELMVTIEFLYSSDCPSYLPTLQLVQEVLLEEGLGRDVRMVRIDTEAEAQIQQFPGSPTIRVDGEDIEGATAPPIGFTCRTYRVPDGAMSPVPSREAIRRAVRAAVSNSERAV
jgi:hypothetical protein